MIALWREIAIARQLQKLTEQLMCREIKYTFRLTRQTQAEEDSNNKKTQTNKQTYEIGNDNDNDNGN